MQSISESFVVDVGENVVHSSILKQIVLYSCKHAFTSRQPVIYEIHQINHHYIQSSGLTIFASAKFLVLVEQNIRKSLNHKSQKLFFVLEAGPDKTLVWRTTPLVRSGRWILRITIPEMHHNNVSE